MTHETDTEPTQDYLTKLRKILEERFNEGELNTLCFDLGVDYDNLSGQRQADKARELVSYLERRNRIPELVKVGERVRPDISWVDASKAPPAIPEDITDEPPSEELPAPPAPTPPEPIPPVPQPSPPPSIEREVGCTGRIGSRIVGLRMRYDKLPTAQQVTVIGIIGTIIVALITLCGTLGAPVVGGVVERWLARPTEVATLTFTPTSTVTATPTPTHTPLPTPTSTHTPVPTPMPTLMPSVTPTITPTPTPDCRGVQVSCLELVLVDSSGQPTNQRYPGQNGEIVIAPSQIVGNLQGQAVLTGTNVADCTCDWMGKTNGVSSMQPISSLMGNCTFSIDLPDQVTVINLMLTVGGGSGPIESFKVKVNE